MGTTCLFSRFTIYTLSLNCVCDKELPIHSTVTIFVEEKKNSRVHIVIYPVEKEVYNDAILLATPLRRNHFLQSPWKEEEKKKSENAQIAAKSQLDIPLA